ncbi:MAG: hypothetical protein HS114_34890 [Anaerolineales bacterium]|nr:hypothetical protein [Anaerolineales bacterium]
MTDYYTLIKTKYPEARGPFESGQNFELTSVPDEVGVYQTVISLWTLAAPQPTLAELDEYAASPEYLAARGAKLKAEAEKTVNDWANQAVMALKILEPELFYVAMVSNIAFRLLEWNTLGKPEEVDVMRFVVTHAEAQAYSETSAPGMTPADLLRLQESRWNQMQQGFAAIVYKRRLALEKIKLAPVDENLPDAMAAILAELETVQTIP